MSKLSQLRGPVAVGAISVLTAAGTVLGARPAAADTISQTFTSTGGEQTFTVPSGITSVHVVAVGARGGTGGFGAMVTGDLTVTPGAVLYLEVGQNGVPNASGTHAFNGGGSSGNASGGGGATDLRGCSLANPGCVPTGNPATDPRRLVAGGGFFGGGGGQGGYSSGGGGGGGSSFVESSATGVSYAVDTTGAPSVTISYPGYQPPVANNDFYQTSTIFDGLRPAAPGVLANDTDPNHDPLTAILVTGPMHGTLILNANGSFSYRPNFLYLGTDTFTYQASDGSELSNVATVTIQVNLL